MKLVIEVDTPEELGALLRATTNSCGSSNLVDFIYLCAFFKKHPCGACWQIKKKPFNTYKITCVKEWRKK